MAYEAFRLPGFIGVNVERRFTTVVSDDTDKLLGTRTRFGVGFQLPTERRAFDPQRNAFGHYGAGGSMGFHDPVRGVSVGYVMNAMGQGWQNSRNQALISALYRCL